MSVPILPAESRVAVLVDCDNTTPEILEYALRVVAQFGRVVLRRGYGNHSTLANTWQDALVRQAFTPCLQYRYAAGKNTSDIALALDALEAMFDHRADKFCLVTSDSDFAYLCRKLRERGATVCVSANRRRRRRCAMLATNFSNGSPRPQQPATRPAVSLLRQKRSSRNHQQSSADRNSWWTRWDCSRAARLKVKCTSAHWGNT